MISIVQEDSAGLRKLQQDSAGFRNKMASALNGRARARSARASAQPTLAESYSVAATYASSSLALVAAFPRVAMLAESFTEDVSSCFSCVACGPSLRLQCLKLLILARFPFHDSQVLCWGAFGSKSAPRRPKSDSILLFFAPRASKSAPRGFQEAFRGLPRRRRDSEPIWDQLLAPKREFGT